MRSEEKPFKGINHGANSIDLRSYGDVIELRPIEIHLKENGATNNEPSFAIVSSKFQTITFVNQISLKMFNEGLKDIGYEIRKI